MAGTSLFAQSRVLTEMYGSEKRFQALVASEAEALTSADSILNFLKDKVTELGKSAGGAALSWVSAELLKALGLGGGPSDLEQIKTMLDKILQQQALILSKLDELLAEVKFQHLITRGWPAHEQITHIHAQLQRLAAVLGQPERERESARLKAAILDVNAGTMLSLTTISDVLLGKDSLGQSDPLIGLFTSRWLPVFLDKQLGVDVPLSTYARRLDDWLHGLFIIQYMGLAQLANARVANGDFELLKQEVDAVVKNMTAQRALLEEAVPAWTRTLPASVVDGRWYVLRGQYVRNGQIDNSQVLYGSPASGFIPLDFSVQFRDRHSNNGDEEWVFEKNGANDGFTLRERSRPRFVNSENRGVRVLPSGRQLRLVMGLTRTPGASSVKGAKLRDLYVPVLGFVGSSDYLCWTRGGNNVATLGPVGQAVPIEIVYAGH